MTRKCDKCKKHAGTETWTGEGGIMAYLHGGMFATYCKCCVLKEQIKYARKAVKRLAGLEKKLERMVNCK